MDFITFYQRNASQLEWSLRKFHSPYCQASNGKRIKAIHSQAIRLFDLPPAGQAENCNLHFHLMGENKGLFKNT